MSETTEFNGLFEIEKDKLTQHQIEEQLTNSLLDFVSVQTNLSEEHWGLIDELIGRHQNPITLCLTFNDESMLAGKPSFDNLDFLSGLRNLKRLEINDPYITHISAVFDCFNLEQFKLCEVFNEEPVSIKGIEKLNKLTSLSLQTSVNDFELINELVQLEKLESWKQKKDFNLSGLTNLTWLYLNSSKSQMTDEFLLHFPKLKTLHLYGDCLSNFKFIHELNLLTELSISKNKVLKDIDFIKDLQQLEILEFWQVSQINSLPDFSNLELKVLKLSQMKRLTDISNILLLKSLEEIEIDHIPHVEYSFWIKLLDELANLKKFRVEFEPLKEWKSLVKETNKRGIDTYSIYNNW
jgi:hypothetical protein